MTDSENAINDFSRACNEVATAKFILAEKKISELLQIIAGSKKLFSIIQSSTESFDFKKELKKAVNGREFILPSGRRKQIALVFSLLYSFDTKKLDIQQFIHNHFSADNVNGEFAVFGATLIANFRKNVEDEYRGVEPDESVPASRSLAPATAKDMRETPSSEIEDYSDFDESSGEIEPVKEKINYTFGDDGSDEKPLDDIQINSLLVCIREIIGVIARDPNLVAEEREELMLISEAFEKAVEFGTPSTIKIMYIGLKNTIRVSSIARPLGLQADNLDRLISEIEI